MRNVNRKVTEFLDQFTSTELVGLSASSATMVVSFIVAFVDDRQGSAGFSELGVAAVAVGMLAVWACFRIGEAARARFDADELPSDVFYDVAVHGL